MSGYPFGYPYQPMSMPMSGFGGYGPGYGHPMQAGTMKGLPSYAPPPPGMMGAGMMGAGMMGNPGLQQQQAAQQQFGQQLGAAGSNLAFNVAPAVGGAALGIAGMAAPMFQGSSSRMVRGLATAADFMDPFTLPFHAVSKGAQAGFGLGGRMGMGMMGRLGMGAMGGASLGALPIAGAVGATMAASYGFQQMHTGAMNRFHGQTFANQIMPSAVPGADPRQEGQATGQMMRSMSEQLGVGMEDVSRFGKQLNSQRVFQTVRSAKEFRSKFKEVMGAVKEIASMTQGTLDDAMGVFNNMRQQGFYSTADIKAQAAKNKAREMTTGISKETYGAIGMAGAQTARAYGMRGRYGAEMAGRTVAGVSGAVRSGAISEEMVMEHGGVEAVGMQMAQRQMGFLRTPRGRAMIAAAMGEGGAPDPERMRQILGGGMTLQGLVTSAAGRGIGTLSQAGSRESREAMMPYAGAGMIRMAMMQQQQIHGNVSRSGIIRHMGTMGVGRDEAEMMMAQVAQMPEQMRQEASASQREAATQAFEQERYRQSIGGRIATSATVTGFKRSARGFGAGISGDIQQMGTDIQRAMSGDIQEYRFDPRNAGYVNRLRAPGARFTPDRTTTSGGLFGGVDVRRALRDEYGANADQMSEADLDAVDKSRALGREAASGIQLTPEQASGLRVSTLGRDIRAETRSELRSDIDAGFANAGAGLQGWRGTAGAGFRRGGMGGAFDVLTGVPRDMADFVVGNVTRGSMYAEGRARSAVGLGGVSEDIAGTVLAETMDLFGDSSLKQGREAARERKVLEDFIRNAGVDELKGLDLSQEQNRELVREVIRNEPKAKEYADLLPDRPSGTRSAQDLVAAKQGFEDSMSDVVAKGLKNRMGSGARSLIGNRTITGGKVGSLKEVLRGSSKAQTLFGDLVIAAEKQARGEPGAAGEVERLRDELSELTGGDEGDGTAIVDEMIGNMLDNPNLAKRMKDDVTTGGYGLGATVLQGEEYYRNYIRPENQRVSDVMASDVFGNLSPSQQKALKTYQGVIGAGSKDFVTGGGFDKRQAAAAAIYEDILKNGVTKDEGKLAETLGTGGGGRDVLESLQALSGGRGMGTRYEKGTISQIFKGVEGVDVDEVQKDLQAAGGDTEKVMAVLEKYGKGIDQASGETTSVGGITVKSPEEANLLMVQLVNDLVQDLKAKGILQDGAGGGDGLMKVHVVKQG